MLLDRPEDNSLRIGPASDHRNDDAPASPKALADLIGGPGANQGAHNIFFLKLVAEKQSQGQSET